MTRWNYEWVKPPEGFPGRRYIDDRYALGHHVAWWKETGKVPAEDEVVHHKNGNPKDNRFDNLELMSRHEHDCLHASQQKRTVVKFVCPSCGSEFTRRKTQTHLVSNNTSRTYCGRSCASKAAHLSDLDDPDSYIVDIFLV